TIIHYCSFSARRKLKLYSAKKSVDRSAHSTPTQVKTVPMALVGFARNTQALRTKSAKLSAMIAAMQYRFALCMCSFFLCEEVYVFISRTFSLSSSFLTADIDDSRSFQRGILPAIISCQSACWIAL